MISVILSPLPTVTALPFGIDSAMSYVVGMWNAFLVDFPPLAIVFQCLLWYYGILLFLLVLKLIFGHRVR
jgi:hypothetical protein